MRFPNCIEVMENTFPFFEVHKTLKCINRKSYFYEAGEPHEINSYQCRLEIQQFYLCSLIKNGTFARTPYNIETLLVVVLVPAIVLEALHWAP